MENIYFFDKIKNNKKTEREICMKYNILKNKDGDILLEVNIGKGRATLFNLDQSLKENAQDFHFIDISIEEYKALKLVVDPSVKQDALNKVIERMEHPTISKEAWKQVKLFLERSLKT